MADLRKGRQTPTKSMLIEIRADGAHISGYINATEKKAGLLSHLTGK